MAALLLLYYLAPAAAAWVGDDRIILSLRVLAFALPFVAASGAMGGYFIAMHQSVKMSLVQLSEQFIRIGCTVLALLRLGGYGLEYACGALTLGMLASEVFSFLALLLLLLASLPRREGRCRTPMLPSLLRITVPLSLSSYARSALSTAQHLLVPRGLRLFGGGAQAALAAYGVIQGMSLPILLFPAALIAVIADLIVPELTEAQVQGRLRGLGYMLERLYRLGLFFSMAVAGACFFFAHPLGELIYSEPAAGQYIRLLAPLVPIMYMDTLVDGMLKGVGEYRANMRYNIIDAATGLLLVWLLLPRYGVAGYLFSISATELLNFALSAARLTRGHGVPAPAALLAAYGGSGSWGLVAAAPDLWQAVVPDRAAAYSPVAGVPLPSLLRGGAAALRGTAAGGAFLAFFAAAGRKIPQNMNLRY